MTLMICFTLAKTKGYKLKCLFKAWPLYPFFVLELLFIVLTIGIFARNHTLMQYASWYKPIYLYSFILPILYYKLYKPAIFGSGLIVIGTVLNKFVMAQNGGKMPVFASLSYRTGYVDSTLQTISSIHMIGNASTKYKVLSDFIDIGYSIMSFGDLFIHLFCIVILFYSIQEINKLLIVGNRYA